MKYSYFNWLLRSYKCHEFCGVRIINWEISIADFGLRIVDFKVMKTTRPELTAEGLVAGQNPKSKGLERWKKTGPAAKRKPCFQVTCEKRRY